MDFVTICFRNELPMLMLQAKSMDKFLTDFPVGQILVIVNDDYVLMKNYLTQILPYYGRLQDKVKFIDGYSLGIVDDDGYHNQMLLKILAAKFVMTEHYCILDAKNFLNKSWQLSDIYDDQNRLLARYSHYDDIVWQHGIQKSFEFFNLDQSQYKKVLIHTPFFAYTDIVKKIAVTNDIVTRFKNEYLVEFPLIQAATIAERGSFESAYFCENDDFNSRIFSCVWVLDILSIINHDDDIEYNKDLLKVNTLE